MWLEIKPDVLLEIYISHPVPLNVLLRHIATYKKMQLLLKLTEYEFIQKVNKILYGLDEGKFRILRNGDIVNSKTMIGVNERIKLHIGGFE